MKIAIYYDHIPKVGGIETAVFNLAKRLAKVYDISIVYRTSEVEDSLFRYATICDVLNITEEIEVDLCILASNHKIPTNIKTDRYLQWVHSDYDKYKLDLKNIDLFKEKKLQYVSVSKHAKKVIERREKITGTEVVYNFVDEDASPYGNPLKLVTASRVSPEKGFDRMFKLATKFKDSGIDFIWTVYGDNSTRKNIFEKYVKMFEPIEEVYFVGYKSNILPALREADYLVQLSDWEGCPLSVLEALQFNIPCITTDWNGVEEIIENGKNGYILPMSMNINRTHIEKITKHIPEFVYKPLSTVDDWIKLIEDEKWNAKT